MALFIVRVCHTRPVAFYHWKLTLGDIIECGELSADIALSLQPETHITVWRLAKLDKVVLSEEHGRHWQPAYA